jgi:drug/metabolite transporter (DMT)-like permease
MTFARSGFLYALAAAFLFGTSTPLAKLFLADMSPWALAGILYLGSGAGLLILWIFRSLIAPPSKRFALTRKDLPSLAGLTLFGGVLAPILLMNGLARTEAAESSLLLNLETVFTVALAWFVFQEPFNRRVLTGMVLILSGAVLLSWPDRPVIGRFWGPLMVAGACLCWAIDNNITRRISEKDPLEIAVIKSLVAGVTNIGLALALGATFPRPAVWTSAGVVGFFCCGVSLYCFILALRHIGTARTSALFSLAPFVGTAMSILLLGYPLSYRIFGAGLLMGLGVWAYLSEKRVVTALS